MVATPLRAVYDGDEVKCPCGRTIAVAVVPARTGARVPCKSCGRWVELDLPERHRGSSPRYPMLGG